MKKSPLFIAISLILNFCVIAQVPDPQQVDLNNKYWSMRERFKKYFIALGSGPGESIPMAYRQAGSI